MPSSQSSTPVKCPLQSSFILSGTSLCTSNHYLLNLYYLKISKEKCPPQSKHTSSKQHCTCTLSVPSFYPVSQFSKDIANIIPESAWKNALLREMHLFGEVFVQGDQKQL